VLKQLFNAANYNTEAKIISYIEPTFITIWEDIKIANPVKSGIVHGFRESPLANFQLSISTVC
jgi:hypothetical protein